MERKTVYLYDPITFEYAGEYLAQESPKQKGDFIAPVHSTTEKPPMKVGSFARFVDDKWLTVVDNSGVWYDVDGNEVLVEDKTATIESTWTRKKPKEKTFKEIDETEYFELVRNTIQNVIDLNAQTTGFSSGNALMLYAGFDNPFKEGALKFAQWEADVWVRAEVYKQKVIKKVEPRVPFDQVHLMMPNIQK